MRSIPLLAATTVTLLGALACGDGGGPDNQAPAAAFGQVCTGLSCVFTDASIDSDGSIASRSWTFESGTPASSSEASQTVTFAAAGTYTVTLTVTDNEGATDDVSQEVPVVALQNQPPVAAFTVSCSSLDCTFNATTSTDPDGTIETYAWTFSDGATLTGPTVTHTFTATTLMNASATLTVTDEDGAVDDATQDFTVAPPANCEAGACDLTLPANASVTITLSNENCNANGNTLRITAPVTATLFTDGCHTPIGTSYSLGNPGQVFNAGTQIKPEVISGSNDLGFPPTLRIRTGTTYPTWILEFDDGESCPANDPACVEPDFDDLEITITATPQ